MRSVLFANLTDRRPSGTAGGEAVTLPRLQAGQQWTIALRFTESEAGVFSEIFPAINALRASVGLIDVRPTGGTYRLQVGTGVSTAQNTTAPLAHNATAAQVAAALNALGGNYTVEWEAGSYLIRQASGGQIALTPRANRLRPMSAVRVRAYQIDNEWVHDVRLIQSPLAFSDSAAQVQPEAPSVETVVDGYTSPDNSWYINEVQQLSVPPQFRGSYRLLFGDSPLPRKTRLLGVEDGPEQLQEALNDILKDLSGFDGEVTVSNPVNNVARIIFAGEALKGVDVAPLQVQAFSRPGDKGDWTMTLDLNRAEIWAALREQTEIQVPFEVEADVLVDKNDVSQGVNTIKLWSVNVRIARPLLYEGLASAQAIDWLRPVSPQSYVPFNSDQIITGQQHWVGTIGFGTAMQSAFGTAVTFGTAGGEQIFTIDHNLETEAVHVTVRQNEAPGLVIDPKIRVEGPNSVSVVFGTAVQEVYAVLITSAGPKSAFQAHTHTISQITDLEALLDELGQRLQTVENIVGLSGAGGTAEESQGNSVLSLPPLADIYPPGRMRGTGQTARLVLPPLPRAIYFGTAALSFGTSTELPEANAQAGNVYQLPSGEVYMPARSPRKGRLISTADAPFVMSDGFEWWLADRKTADSNIFYPVEMNRTLWEVAITPEMLAPGRRLSVKWSVFLAMLAERPELRSVYTMRVRKGTLTSEVNFGTASNIEAVTWDEVDSSEEPMFEQRISMTRSGVVHPFELEISRSTSGALTAKRAAYGKSLAAPPPQNTQFILRAELVRFDLENYTNAMGRPVGQIYLQVGKATEGPTEQIEKIFPLESSSGESASVQLLTLTASIA